MHRSLLSATVGAQDVVSLGEEAPPHQRHGTLHAGEALAVPLTLLEGDVLGSGETCRQQTGFSASRYRRRDCHLVCLSVPAQMYNQAAEYVKEELHEPGPCGCKHVYSG